MPTIEPATPIKLDSSTALGQSPTLPAPQAGLIPFQVDFGKVPKNDSQRQAREILDEVHRLHNLGAKTVGITYSANQDQTDKIIATYQSNQWKTGTTGSNQADVIKQIEKLLATEYQHLQTVYRTVPITTMKYFRSKAMAADDASIKKSLKNADDFIADGGILLGWTNQFTKPGQLAIGGGVANKIQTTTQKQMINSWIQRNLSSIPLVIVDVPTQENPHAKSNPEPVASEEVIEMRKKLDLDYVGKIEKIKAIKLATVYAQNLSQSERTFMYKSCDMLIKTIEQGKIDIKSAPVPKTKHSEIEEKIGKHLDGILKESKNVVRTSGIRGFINKIFVALGFTQPFTITNSATIDTVKNLKFQLTTVKDEEVLERGSIFKKDS